MFVCSGSILQNGNTDMESMTNAVITNGRVTRDVRERNPNWGSMFIGLCEGEELNLDADVIRVVKTMGEDAGDDAFAQ
jgi:hypothetical protein